MINNFSIKVFLEKILKYMQWIDQYIIKNKLPEPKSIIEAFVKDLVKLGFSLFVLESMVEKYSTTHSIRFF